MADRASVETIQTDFDARLKTLNAPARIALAVSGGRDSMALLRLSADYARRTGAQLFALTVDHGLRIQAKKEAADVQICCNTLGIVHETLVWRGEKPAAGVQAAARNARYRLLIGAAQRHRCDALLTAHTEDDQAETLFMRLARGAGVSGLSSMVEDALIAAGPGEALRLLRPLLTVSRAAITEYLSEIRQPFVDDPSNEDPAFERVRMRALLAALSEQDFMTAEKLAATACKLQETDARLRAQEDAAFDRLGGCLHPWGGVSLARLLDLPETAGLARRLIYAAGAAAYAPSEREARAALTQAAETGAATLAGALVKRWSGRLWFLREPAALTGRAGVGPAAPVPLQGPLLWDRRFIVAPAAKGLFIGPLGNKAEGFLGPRMQLFQGPREALAALPGLFLDGALIGAPALPFMGETRAIARSLIKERYHGDIVRFS